MFSSLLFCNISLERRWSRHTCFQSTLSVLLKTSCYLYDVIILVRSSYVLFEQVIGRKSFSSSVFPLFSNKKVRSFVNQYGMLRTSFINSLNEAINFLWIAVSFLSQKLEMPTMPEIRCRVDSPLEFCFCVFLSCHSILSIFFFIFRLDPRCCCIMFCTL